MKKQVIIYWARRDLRWEDNPALHAAFARARASGADFLPVFFVEPYMRADTAGASFGYPSRWFLSHALPPFAKRFQAFLALAERPARWFHARAKEWEIELFVNEDVYPDFYAQLKKIQGAGVGVKLFADQLTVSKETKTGEGNVYSVFTPFKNAVWEAFCRPVPLPHADGKAVSWMRTDDIPGRKLSIGDPQELLGVFSTHEQIEISRSTYALSDFHLPVRDLANWYVTEREANHRLEAFLEQRVNEYHVSRDQLGDPHGTSQLSLALTWGLLSVRQIVAALHRRLGHQGAQAYVSELIWREFYKYLFFHRPELAEKPFQATAEHIRWESPSAAAPRFRAWARGETGYPLVDAAMRQLAVTGWMHNRARMVVSSFLTKHLGVDWRWGQEYFRAMLIDLDEASNIGGWQWGASVGADPKPIRIFNPTLQAERYDPEAAYRRRWLPPAYLERPPEPIVAHAEARTHALARYAHARRAA